MGMPMATLFECGARRLWRVAEALAQQSSLGPCSASRATDQRLMHMASQYFGVASTHLSQGGPGEVGSVNLSVA